MTIVKCHFFPTAHASKFSLTVVVLVMGAPADHLSLVLGLLVNGRGSQNGALWWLHCDHDFNGCSFSDLTVQLVELLGELKKTQGESNTPDCLSCENKRVQKPRSGLKSATNKD